jgi:probable rRNA maturation factor
MTIDLVQRQTRYRVREQALRQYAGWIMEQVSLLEPSLHWESLSLVLTDDSIRDLNREWFDRDTVTDVISFAYPPGPGESGHSGEVIVNLQQADEEGRLRTTPDEELALYIAHGCHHLMGADDATEAEKTAMLDLETRWVEQAGSQGLTGLFFS